MPAVAAPPTPMTTAGHHATADLTHAPSPLRQVAADHRTLLALCALCSVLAGCALPYNKAPVEDRSAPLRPVTPPPLIEPPRPAATGPLAANAEFSGRTGYYTVRPGDTLIRVGLETGQNWRDLQRWNNLDNPNVLEIGQVLRVFPPGQDPSATTVRPVVTSRIETRPPAGGASAVSPPASSTSSPLAGATAPVGAAPSTSAAPMPASTAAPAPVAPRDADEDVTWAWPAQGPLISSFDESRNKGVAIAGKAGDPVVAAADGRVVYAGSGLRGYGNLIIIKHNDTYLTAYAHNQALLVKEDQPVRRGQKIAEMGASDADRVQLHFEIRRKGKPMDPTRMLPSR
ncbi:MAG: lipoprotein NlpD [Pseudomonadota bacterium]